MPQNSGFDLNRYSTIRCPVLWNIGLATQGVRLGEIDLRVDCLQQRVSVTWVCALDIPDDLKAKTIPIAFPLGICPATMQQRIMGKVTLPVRDWPLARFFTDMVVTVDDLKCPNDFVHEAHPQAQAPSMYSIADEQNWLIVQVPRKTGRHILTVQYQTAYRQHYSVDSHGQIDGMRAPCVYLDMLPLYTWGALPQQANLTVYSSQMLPGMLHMQPENLASVDEAGTIQVPLIGTDGELVIKQITVQAGQAWRYLPNENISLGKRQGWANAQYAITTREGAILRDPYDAVCSPEHLKQDTGYWGMDCDMPGALEKPAFELMLSQAKPLRGLWIESGINPMKHADVDPEAMRNYNLYYAMHARPKLVEVTLNGEYTFPVTLQDHWAPQLIYPSYYVKPVKTVSIQIKSIYPGAANNHVYINVLKPVIGIDSRKKSK